MGDLPHLSDHIGSFSLSSIHPADPAYTPLLYRLREETFQNRTTQVRHGSYLRRFTRDTSFNIAEAIKENSGIDLNNFMRRYGLTGCVVVQNGAIKLEEYRHGNSQASRNDVQSVTKSFVATALAIAQQEGKLYANDPVSRHVEELRGTAWADVPLLALSSMSSGVVEQSEEERPADVPNPMYATELYPQTDTEAVINWLKTSRKVAEPWEEFHYYNPNYYVLSTAISRATGEPLNEYISRTIWDPAGMQYDGYIRTTGAGHVDGHGGLSITLTDMARFGCFILESFRDGGKGPNVPPGWFQDISDAKNSVGARALQPDNFVSNFGYESGWWTTGRADKEYKMGDDGAFAAIGMYGQSIYIVPKLDAVIAIQSGYPEHELDLFTKNAELATAILKALRDQ
ncbi:hypothetical protein FOYG_08589 [Fusarium oxysporum NRRL 32931]|uniref:Beta-lactamase-related domain-containing protein n=1 Tax=Fusarium oxysporum NRRL 32931 TaxID=660029 RepID=W9IG79_FUSOX|nr:hypothetical protein FOYG_08589 [Fusarium oxysporum NRRL 32931]